MSVFLQAVTRHRARACVVVFGLKQGLDFEEQTMSTLAIRMALACGAFAWALIPASAQSPVSEKIPNLASANFGWQTNVADWQEPPAGSGHGPIASDPEHPFNSNAEAGRSNTQPTLRIGDAKDPVLKP